MAGMFARCNASVVTTLASPRNLRMIHMADPSPTECGVAELTSVRRVNVLAVLALRGAAVMACKTVTRDCPMVEASHMPAHRGMTIVALIVTADMAHRFTARIGIVMTAIAQHGSPDELAFVMTSVALDNTMLAGQGKTGGKMVEFAAGRQQRITRYTTNE